MIRTIQITDKEVLRYTNKTNFCPYNVHNIISFFRCTAAVNQKTCALMCFCMGKHMCLTFSKDDLNGVVVSNADC
jgi:hypothetical protein